MTIKPMTDRMLTLSPVRVGANAFTDSNTKFEQQLLSTRKSAQIDPTSNQQDRAMAIQNTLKTVR